MRYIDADELIEFFDGYPDHIEFDVEDIKSIINEQDAADVVECVQRNEDFDRVIEELLEIEAKNDIGYFTSSERSQFNTYVEDLLSMTIERADA